MSNNKINNKNLSAFGGRGWHTLLPCFLALVILSSCGIVGQEEAKKEDTGTSRSSQGQTTKPSSDDDLDGIANSNDGNKDLWESLEVEPHGVEVSITPVWSDGVSFDYSFNCSKEHYAKIEKEVIRNRVLSEAYQVNNERGTSMPAGLDKTMGCFRANEIGAIELANNDYKKSEGIRLKAKGNVKFKIPQGVFLIENIRFAIGKYDSNKNIFTELGDFTLIDQTRENKQISVAGTASSVISVPLLHSDIMLNTEGNEDIFSLNNGIFIKLKDYTYKTSLGEKRYVNTYKSFKESRATLRVMSQEKTEGFTTKNVGLTLGKIKDLYGRLGLRSHDNRIVGVFDKYNTSLDSTDVLSADINNLGKGMVYALGFENNLEATLPLSNDNIIVHMENLDLLKGGGFEKNLEVSKADKIEFNAKLGSTVNLTLDLKRAKAKLVNHQIRTSYEYCVPGSVGRVNFECHHANCHYTHQRIGFDEANFNDVSEYLKWVKLTINGYEVDLENVSAKMATDSSEVHIRFNIEPSLLEKGVHALRNENTVKVESIDSSISLLRKRVNAGDCDTRKTTMKGDVLQTVNEKTIFQGSVSIKSVL
ncbi:hypothetical protein [Halobacteriovorax sp. CON-3]|uniref:hypothetical protein n=1 Tax=Halobacteriovorax sp. CON-3 TaxID=3157710 RepID=UPI0037101C1E